MARNNITFVDLVEAFRNQEKMRQYVANDEWHPNEEGHDVIAKQLQHIVLRHIDSKFTGEE